MNEACRRREKERERRTKRGKRKSGMRKEMGSVRRWMDNVGASMAANNVTDTCHFLRGLSISEIIATNLICTWGRGLV